MQTQQLKRLIESGDYRPAPAEIAQAMLRRRAVRELLIGTPLNPADRIQSPAAVPRQAA